jgi:TolB protein
MMSRKSRMGSGLMAAGAAMLAAIVLVATLAGLLGRSAKVQAEPDVRLKITSQDYAKIQIGFKEADQKVEDRLRDAYRQFTEVVGHDLEVSGYFEIVKHADKEGVNAVVESAPHRDGDDYSFEVRLADGVSDQTIFKRKYGSSPSTFSETAHIVADDIVYALTGRPGIANTRLAFVAGPRGKSYIYLAPLDGSERTRLTDIGTIVMSPSWSPDGSRLAYVSYQTGTPAIYVMDVSSLTTTRFASFAGMNATPAWSPDGRSLAVTLSKDGNPEIYIVSLDGSTEKRITYYSGIDCSPSWAPNGLEIAFTSDRAGGPQIFVTDTEGLYARQITTEGDYNTSPAWSPDGSLIAYVSRIDGKFQVCTVDPFGVTMRVLTTSGSNEDPKWSADGMHIAFSSTGSGNSGIYMITRDGGERHKLIDGLERPRNPAWSPPLGYGKQPPVEG